MSCFDLIQEMEPFAKKLSISTDLKLLRIMLLIRASSKQLNS